MEFKAEQLNSMSYMELLDHALVMQKMIINLNGIIEDMHDENNALERTAANLELALAEAEEEMEKYANEQ